MRLNSQSIAGGNSTLWDPPPKKKKKMSRYKAHSDNANLCQGNLPNPNTNVAQSSPKSNQFLLVAHRAPQKFHQNRKQLLEPPC